MSDATCPFCDAPWTTAMLDTLERATVTSGCACCGGDPTAHQVEDQERALPQADIACAQCGRTLFRAPDALQEGAEA